MIIFWLFLDLFFYNYTFLSTCFFLLTFFQKKISFIYLIIVGVLWDIFILHTFLVFPIMLIYFYFMTRKLKGSLADLKVFLIRFGIVTLSFWFFSLVIFKGDNLYLYGLFFNFLILLMGVIFYY